MKEALHIEMIHSDEHLNWDEGLDCLDVEAESEEQFLLNFWSLVTCVLSSA